MAIVQRKTIDEVIAERGGDVGVNVGDGGNSGGNVAVMKLTYRQQIILSFIAKHFDITAKQMAVMSGIPQRTIERELSFVESTYKKCLREECGKFTGYQLLSSFWLKVTRTDEDGNTTR